MEFLIFNTTKEKENKKSRLAKMGKQHKLLDAHFITASQEALVLQKKNILKKNLPAIVSLYTEAQGTRPEAPK